VAEEQTYTAIRKLWNHTINQSLVRPWGFRFWRFKLKAPRLQQVDAVAALIKVLTETNVFTPDQLIPVAASLLGIDVLGEPAPWQKVPPKAALAGMTDDFLRTPDDPMTVEDESEGDQPGETAITGEEDGESARGLLEQLGMMVSGFVDGPAQKMRERIGLARQGTAPMEEDSTGPDFWTVDD
jgi:hypothetical protein